MFDQISKKKYLCTLCKKEVQKETNHYNEIYSQCKKCKNDILICIEDIAIDNRNNCEDIAFKRIIFYNYDTRIDEELKEYNKLLEYLKEKKYNIFSVFDQNSLRWEYFKELDNTLLKIFKPNTFKEQYIGEGYRLHNWYERILPSRLTLKIGYYLEDK